MGKLRQKLLGIPEKEIRCERRGFNIASPDIKTRIEKIGETFVFGYHAALINDDNPVLEAQLNTIDLEWRGFAYEGAAMTLALLDLMTPWQKTQRMPRFLQGPGNAHAYMVHVGAGWAMARIPWGMAFFNKLDPLLRWLALDGYGFHQGYFAWPKYVSQQQIPDKLTAYQQRVFDQGLGRSLWFSKGAQIQVITALIADFSISRQSDLWSGVGLAAAYAGGVEANALEKLIDLAGYYRPHLAQGAAFAAKTRQRAGNPAEHTETACRIICKMSLDQAAKLTDDTLLALPADNALPAYEHWRQRIQHHFMMPE